MSFKRLIITALIISHLLINCAWAAVHMAESGEAGFEPLHVHTELHDEAQSHQNNPGDLDTATDSDHDDDRCHVHIVYQVATSNHIALSFSNNPLPLYDTRNYLDIDQQPPVPPPTSFSRFL